MAGIVAVAGAVATVAPSISRTFQTSAQRDVERFRAIAEQEALAQACDANAVARLYAWSGRTAGYTTVGVTAMATAPSRSAAGAAYDRLVNAGIASREKVGTIAENAPCLSKTTNAAEEPPLQRAGFGGGLPLLLAAGLAVGFAWPALRKAMR